MEIDFPKGVGARVNPDLIRQKYRPEEILTVIEQAREGLADIVFFLHKKRPQLALRSDLRHGRRVLKDAALMYDIDKNERVGFYRRSMTSLRRQEEAVVIRER